MNKIPLNITYIQLCSTYAPSWGFGGVVRILYDYAQWMADDLFEVHVLTSDMHHDYSVINIKNELLGKVKLTRVKMFFKHSLAQRNINFVSLKMLGIAFNLIKKASGTVVIHVGELRSSATLYAVILKSLFPKKVTLIYSPFGHLHEKKSNIRDFYDSIFLSYFVRKIDVALAQNQHEVECLRLMSKKYNKNDMLKIKIFPLHSAVPDYINEAITNNIGKKIKNKIRSNLNIDNDVFVVVFLGRLHLEKGIIRSIDAFSEFYKLFKGNTRFLIIGVDNGFQVEVEKHIELLRLGHVIDIINNVFENRFDYYYASDLYIGCPTIYEETMLASVEALCCSTPVLLSKEADIPYVNEENSGFVIDFTVKGAVMHMLNVANNISEFSERAKKTAAKHFKSSESKKQFINLLIKCE